MTSNRHCVGLSLDIQAAFDSITPNTIKAALLKHGGDPQLVQWYYNYLIHRNLITTIQNDTFTASNAIGFPQGGVVSADFWKIAFNPALEIINSNLTTGFGYADDLMILRHGYKPEASVNAIQTILNRLINWGETCNLKFNPTKTLMIIFSSKKTTPKSTIPLKINDQDVTTVNSIRYLGVTLDSKLSWDQHRNITIQNAKQNLVAISQKIAKTWGPKPHISKWIYTGIIRPKILYASMNWGHTLNTKKVKDQYDKLNRIALHMITPCRKSISTASLEIIYDLLPLPLMLSLIHI